jgi:hypothetical protein
LPITKANEKVVSRDVTVETKEESSPPGRIHKQEKTDIIMKVKHVIEKHRESEPINTGRSQRSLSKTPSTSKREDQGSACFKNSVSRLNMAPLYEAPGPGSYNPPGNLHIKQTK